MNEKLSGIGGLTAKNIKGINKYIRMSDGPAGLTIRNMLSDDKDRKSTTAIPIETALAQSFNIELIEQNGKIIAN